MTPAELIRDLAFYVADHYSPMFSRCTKPGDSFARLAGWQQELLRRLTPDDCQNVRLEDVRLAVSLSEEASARRRGVMSRFETHKLLSEFDRKIGAVK